MKPFLVLLFTRKAAIKGDMGVSVWTTAVSPGGPGRVLWETTRASSPPCSATNFLDSLKSSVSISEFVSSVVTLERETRTISNVCFRF